MNCKEIKKIITNFIHDEVKNTGLKNVVIGLSGGIDSSVVATLAVEALGKDRVHGILMPETTSLCNSLNTNFIDAQKLTASLGIDYSVIPVCEVINKNYIDYMERFIEDDKERMVRVGNIKARARMTILYDQAMQRKAIVLGTTNKTELLLGYFTKYGDGGVDIEPIADLYKTEVFRLAKYIGVSDNIINKPPSADLWDGQTDEGELGATYEEIDQLLWWMNEEEYDARSLRKELGKLTSVKDPKVLELVLEIMSKNHHKTSMAPVCEIPDTDLKAGLLNSQCDD